MRCPLPAMTRRREGFTLIEILLSVVILAVASTLTYFTFSTVTMAWKRGMALTDELHHGDFVMEQLVMALRSAYYPDSRRRPANYGFWLENNGDGDGISDEISWVKIGSSLIGKSSDYALSPHRIRFWIGRDEEGEPAAMITSWRLHGQPDEFDPSELEPVVIGKKVTGFNCSPAWPYVDDDEEIEWLTEWFETNKLPTAVELTLYMEPLEEDGPPVEIKRLVGIPVAPLSGPWRKKDSE